ncbi:MAG: exodeoxyribonuclease III [Campylobacter sp.]|nr:exodeoxyribonuclease III [Campylobacter sp.]
MKLLSWNVNGIRAVLNKNNLEFFKDFDFIGLQEIKAKEEQIPAEIYSLGFKEISVNSAQKAGYSGVLSLSKFGTTTTKSMFFDDDEGRVLEHRFKDIIIFNIYFPNGQKDDERLAYKMKFYKDFLAYINELKRDFHIIICGDVNTAHQEIDLKNPKTNSKTSGFLPIERAWIDELLESGFIDTFRLINGDEVKYSWWSYRFNARAKNVGWRIDYFFVSQSLKDRLKDAFIMDEIYGSDHCPVGIELEI